MPSRFLYLLIMGKINICIVHYNTPKLTECLVRSINKFVPESTIYIFDNSDKLPFTYRQGNIMYFDNTKGQIINFDEWLNSIKTKVTLGNKHASAKHCYTVQKCMELIDDDFILLDSDVLLKKDITPLFDSNYAYVGDTELWQGNRRVIPYCCFINVKKCKENGINYYNEKYIVGLTKSCRYDTGAYFWLECEKLPHKTIKYTDYIVHLDDGSQKYENSKKHEEWLLKYKSLYSDNNTMDSKNETYLQDLKNFIKKRVSFLNVDFKNPKTIQEKIQWLKIFDTTPLKTKCADKIKIHEYCKEKLGEDICIPILKVYDNVSQIKWEELPEEFVIKCNHGSGMNIIVPDKSKLNKSDAVAKLSRWMATDFAFQNGCELQYHDIERKIFVEKYEFDESQKSSLFDYKFWCFNGVPKFYTINDGHGHGDILYYTMDDEIMNPYMVTSTHAYKKPKGFDRMVQYAKKLSSDFKFVRVDFYEVNSQIYLGELTFTPGSGFFRYKDKKYDTIFGDMLKIKNEKVIYTCITGSYELLDDPFVISPGYDYVCFTNYSKVQSNVWQIRPIPEELNGLSEVKKQRCIKINAHKYLPEYNFSIWVDGSVKLKKDVNEFIDKNCKDGHIFIPSHPQRKCIYEEMDACVKQKKDTAANIEPQKIKYKNENFPKNFGLVQSNIMLRYHNEPDCIKLMETWWEEVKNGSHRDQLSFDYARWKNPDANFVFIDKGTCKTDYFKWDSSHGKGRIKKAITNITKATTSATTSPTIREAFGIETQAEKQRERVLNNNLPSYVTPTIRRKILSKRLKKFIEMS